jgi:hypothetical protein
VRLSSHTLVGYWWSAETYKASSGPTTRAHVIISVPPEHPAPRCAPCRSASTCVALPIMGGGLRCFRDVCRDERQDCHKACQVDGREGFHKVLLNWSPAHKKLVEKTWKTQLRH